MTEKIKGTIRFAHGSAVQFEAEAVEHHGLQVVVSHLNSRPEIILRNAFLSHIDSTGRTHGEVVAGKPYEPTFHSQISFGGLGLTVQFDNSQHPHAQAWNQHVEDLKKPQQERDDRDMEALANKVSAAHETFLALKSEWDRQVHHSSDEERK